MIHSIQSMNGLTFFKNVWTSCGRPYEADIPYQVDRRAIELTAVGWAMLNGGMERRFNVWLIVCSRNEN